MSKTVYVAELNLSVDQPYEMSGVIRRTLRDIRPHNPPLFETLPVIVVETS